MERKQPGNGTSNNPETEGEQAKQGPLSVAEILKRNQNDKWKDGNRYDYNPAMRAVMGDIVAQNKHHAPDKPDVEATPEQLARTGRHADPAEAVPQTGEAPRPRTPEAEAAYQAAEARRGMYEQAQREATNEQERAVPLYHWLDDNNHSQFGVTPPTDRSFQQIGNLNAAELPSTHRPGEAPEDDDEYETDDDENDEASRTNAADRAGTRYWMGLNGVSNWFARRRRNRENREAAERTQLPNESDEDYENRMRGTNRRSKWKRILGIGAITAVAGAYLANRAHVFNFADMVDDVTFWDTDREQAQHAQAEAARVKAEHDAFVARFVYDPNEDWALKDNKDFINDFGPHLAPNPDTDGVNRFPGYGDFVDNRIVDNQRQFATALSEAGFRDAPQLDQFNGDDQAFSVALNAWADKHTPEQLAEMYLDYRHNWLEHKDTKFEVMAIDAPYESYHQDRADGLVKYDRHADHGGTMVKVTYPSGKVAWLRLDCSQWIRPNAVVPVEQTWVPENNVWSGGEQAAWSGTGGQAQQHVQGQSRVIWKQQWGGGTPPEGEPPTGEPPVGEPPTGEPPVGEPPTGEPPVDDKGNAYPENENRDPLTGSGPLEAPADVDTSETTDHPNGGPAATDHASVDQGSPSGGQSHESGVGSGNSDVDTSGNSGAGTGIEGGNGAAGVGGAASGAGGGNGGNGNSTGGDSGASTGEATSR